MHCSHAPGCLGKRDDRLLGLSFLGYGRGDLVAFKPSLRAQQRCGLPGLLLKRVVGLPGETVSERDGRIRIDGRALREPYVEARLRDTGTQDPVKLGHDEYYLLGDNREESCDSRTFGPVPKHEIRARIVMTYWPLGRIGFH